MMKKRTQGFSLVEVMITLSIMGAAAVAFMKFQQTQMKSNKATRDRIALSEYISNVKGYLKKPGVCTNSFKDTRLQDEQEVEGVFRPDLKYKYKVGEKVKGSSYVLKKMEFSEVFVDKGDLTNRHRAEAQLKLYFEKPRKNSYGGTNLTRELELDFLVDGLHKIIECAPLGELTLSKSALFNESSADKAKPRGSNQEGLGESEIDRAFKSAVEQAQKATGETLTQKDLNKVIKENPQMQEMMKSLENYKKMQKKLDKMLENN